jgi:AcrR family transcriptional regulator
MDTKKESGAGKPKKESGVSKLEHAFWSCLEEKPYDRMTVSEVVRRAGVNRALFYYHFDNLAVLAERAVRETVPLDIARIFLEQNLDAEAAAGRIAEMDDVEGRMQKLRLVVGPHGTVALVEIVKEIIRGEWLRIYGLGEKDVDEATSRVMAFILGGIVSMWAGAETKDVWALQRTIANSGIAPMAASVLRDRLSQLAAARDGVPDIRSVSGRGKPASR